MSEANSALIGTYSGDEAIGAVIPKLAAAGVDVDILCHLDDAGWEDTDVLDVTKNEKGYHLSLETKYFYIESK